MVTSNDPTGGARFDPRWGTFCRRCGVEAPTKNVAFRQNIGLVFLRLHSEINGDLCKHCIHAEFWKRQAINCVGWFGTISFIVAPIYMIMNFYNYATAATLPPATNRTDANDPAAIKRLAKAFKPFVARLQGGESVDAVLPDLCRAANATTEQGRVFLRMASKGRLLSS